MASDLISRERAVRTIGDDRLRVLAECHQVGWIDWLTIRETRAGASLSKSARARIVYDGAVRHARASFPSVMCGQRHGLLILDFGNLLSRFKLLDRELTPRGIPTDQAVMFEQQNQMEQLAVWPNQPMLIVGYILDRLGTTIERQVLVLRRGGEVVWQHDLPLAGEVGGDAEITILPTPPRPPVPADIHSGRPDVEVRKEAE